MFPQGLYIAGLNGVPRGQQHHRAAADEAGMHMAISRSARWTDAAMVVVQRPARPR